MAYEPYPLAPHLEAFTDVCAAIHADADPAVISALKMRLAREEAALMAIDIDATSQAGNGVPRIDHNYLLTAKQLGMILSLCREKGLIADEFCVKTVGKLPDDLSKREAGEVITKLREAK